MDLLLSMGYRENLGFLDVWRFLNCYGSLYFTSSGQLYEVKASLREDAEGQVKRIRLIKDNEDYASICEKCWNLKNTCNGSNISGFREKIIEFIFKVYIE